MDLDLEVSHQQDIITSSLEEIDFARKITSLNNTAGGKLLIGINEKGKVVGVYPKDELENIPIVLANFCTEIISYTSETVEVNKKLIVVLTIEKKGKIAVVRSNETPIYYFRIETTICFANKIIEKLWRYEKAATPVAPCTKTEQENVYEMANNRTLTQIYNYSNHPKTVVDTTISWLLYIQKLRITLKDKQIIYQHLG